MVDKTGADALQFTETEEAGRMVRVPVLPEAHKKAMIHDLYRAGWSTWLISQLCHDDHEVTLGLLSRPLAD